MEFYLWRLLTTIEEGVRIYAFSKNPSAPRKCTLIIKNYLLFSKKCPSLGHNCFTNTNTLSLKPSPMHFGTYCRAFIFAFVSRLSLKAKEYFDTRTLLQLRPWIRQVPEEKRLVNKYPMRM